MNHPRELRFKPDACPLRASRHPLSVERGLVRPGRRRGRELPFAALLHGLQQRSAAGDADWRALEPAVARLAELIAPEEARTVITAAGEDWWVEIGPVDLTGPIVAIQRQDELIAALCAHDDGRLRLATYRPLDGKSARPVFGLSFPPHPEYGVCMRENNWEYALDVSAGMGQWYAMDRGEVCLAGWPHGIGVMNDGAVRSSWRAMRTLPAWAPSVVAIELGVAYAFSDADDA